MLALSGILKFSAKNITHDVLCHVLLFYRFIVAFRHGCFFDLNIKLGKTKQKEITFVATALKALLAVTKANGRFSRRKLNTGHVYDLFRNFLFIYPPSAYKKGAQPKPRTEKRELQVVAKRTYTPIDITPSNGSRIFTKWIRFMVCTKKGINIP